MIDTISIVPGGSVLEYTHTIPASGIATLSTQASNTIVTLSSTPQVVQNYMTNGGTVIAPTSSPYALSNNPVVPTVNITLYPIGGVALTLNGVSSVAVLPINVYQISIQNTTSVDINVHIIQSTN